MLTPTIIVAGQGELWLAALRTCVRRSAPLQVEPVWLHFPDRNGVAPAIARSGSPFVVVEVTSPTAASDVLQLGQWRDAFPAACFVAAIDRHQDARNLYDLVWALREAGAAHVLTSPRRAAEALPLLERHWQRIGATGEDADGTWSRPLESFSQLPSCWNVGEEDLIRALTNPY